MKKSSKIWKIVDIAYPVYSGQLLLFVNHPLFKDGIKNTQLIYDSDLDCLLDIVTDTDNQGLKVYRHKNRVEKEPVLSSAKTLLVVEPKVKKYEFTSECMYWDLKDFETIKETHVISESFGEFEVFEYKEYHWVDAYMQ
jgi:hypothetical protein